MPGNGGTQYATAILPSFDSHVIMDIKCDGNKNHEGHVTVWILVNAFDSKTPS